MSSSPVDTLAVARRTGLFNLELTFSSNNYLSGVVLRAPNANYCGQKMLNTVLIKDDIVCWFSLHNLNHPNLITGLVTCDMEVPWMSSLYQDGVAAGMH